MEWSCIIRQVEDYSLGFDEVLTDQSQRLRPAGLKFEDYG
jgi:hypothetical protein